MGTDDAIMIVFRRCCFDYDASFVNNALPACRTAESKNRIQR